RDVYAVAVLVDVTDAARRPADDEGAGDAVVRTIVVRAVAGLDQVADAGRRTADRRALGVGGTVRSGAGAVLVPGAPTSRPAAARSCARATPPRIACSSRRCRRRQALGDTPWCSA